MKYTFLKYQKIEGLLHLMFWVFIFSAVNVSWHRNWFDPGLRPNTPSPLSVVLFPLLFYAHAYWAMPRFFETRKWLTYGLSLIFIFAAPELIRLLFYSNFLNRPFQAEMTSRDSFIFGSLNVAWVAFIFSFIYRLFVDRVFIDLPGETNSRTARISINSPPMLSVSESREIMDALTRAMNDKKLFLQQDLKLSNLSAELNITDKKLSSLLNQHLNTSFTDYINGYRVKHFVAKVEDGKLKHLSITGLANKSGFSSKTTFYRSFKKIKGCTPTEFLNS